MSDKGNGFVRASSLPSAGGSGLTPTGTKPIDKLFEIQKKKRGPLTDLSTNQPSKASKAAAPEISFPRLPKDAAKGHVIKGSLEKGGCVQLRAADDEVSHLRDDRMNDGIFETTASWTYTDSGKAGKTSRNHYLHTGLTSDPVNPGKQKAVLWEVGKLPKHLRSALHVHLLALKEEKMIKASRFG